MSVEHYRLYAGKEIFNYATLEAAKESAKLFMPNKISLRIEVLIEIDENQADFLAYEYESKQWAPS